MTQHLISKEGWQPIETLPLVVRRFIGWCVLPAGAEVREIERRGEHFFAYGVRQNVTHWRHFPTPPAGEQA